jgi:hypothetical protein
MKLFLPVCLFAVSTVALAQIPGYPIALQPGDYKITDTSKILDTSVNLTKQLQGQDWEMYQKVLSESGKAYNELYGSCDSSKCTNFQELRRMSILTTKAKTVASFKLQDIITVQQSYISSRDKLLQQLAAIEVTKEVWDGIISSNYSEATKLEYRKAAMNFGKLADTYRNGIAQMDTQASTLEYKYESGAGIRASDPNKGLEAPNSPATAEVIKAELESKVRAMSFTQPERDLVSAVHWNMTYQMLNFRDSRGQKLIFFTKGQDENNQQWIKDVETQARLLAFVRGASCMPLGAPAVDIPQETATSQFTVFLTRDLNKVFQLRQGVVRELGQLREMKRRMERIFVSLQSQNGEFNSQGGVMSYVHRANSTFTWHNQVAANFAIMKILFEMINDEIDVISPDPEGCSKVRARYNARHGSFNDASFGNVVDRYLGGEWPGGAPDDITKSFASAGQAILARGEIAKEVRMYKRDHPAASSFRRILDPDLK